MKKYFLVFDISSTINLQYVHLPLQSKNNRNIIFLRKTHQIFRTTKVQVPGGGYLSLSGSYCIPLRIKKCFFCLVVQGGLHPPPSLNGPTTKKHFVCVFLLSNGQLGKVLININGSIHAIWYVELFTLKGVSKQGNQPGLYLTLILLRGNHTYFNI